MGEQGRVQPIGNGNAGPASAGFLGRTWANLVLVGARLWLTVLLAGTLLVAVAFIRGPLYVVLPGSVYLPLHTLAEVLAIVVGFAIFAVHWHVAVSQRLRQSRALFLGAAFLGVALLDTLHILAFPGMPGLFQPGTTERGIYYWLTARLWAALALLVAAFLGPQTREHPLLRRWTLLAFNLLPVGLLVIADTTFLARADLFYVEGVGLTPLKRWAEIVIVALSLVTAVFYWRLFERTHDRSFAMIVVALGMTVFSELSFTLYSTAYDTFNLLGHVYKVIAYYLIFDGLFVAALLRPYAQLDTTMRDLEASNRDLTSLREHVEGELARTIVTLEQTSRAERRARESAEALAHLARDIAAQVGLSELLETLVARTKEIFGADFVALATVEVETGLTTWRAITGNRSDAINTVTFPQGKGMAGRSIETNAPVVVERLGEDAALPMEEFPLLMAEGARSAVSVPIGTGSEAFGAFVIGYRQEHHVTPEELGLARGVADHAAVAIQSARLYEELNRRMAELDAVINSLADGVIVYDPDAKIVRLNRAAAELLAYDADEMGKPISERATKLRLADAQGRPLSADENPTMRALRGEAVVGQEIMMHHPDGSVHRVAISVAPVHDAEGHVLGLVSSLHDITDLVELERRREEFLRIVAHDIRQPLTIIQGQAQLMRRALASGNQARIENGVTAILTSAKRTNAMIRDLVDSVRLESGRVELDKQPLDLAGFVAEMLERMTGVMEAQRVRLEAGSGLWPGEDGQEGVPLVEADPDRLERIFANLLSNALKYSTPDSEVTVTLGREDGEVVVAVSDRGAGIAAEDLSHIFERFYRANGQHRAESLGLGLYITRMLVEAHGGRIWAESEPGVGSTFAFTLPLS